MGGQTSTGDTSDPVAPIAGPHIPVLLKEVIAGLDVRPGGAYIDGTVGAGGHAAAIMERAEGGRLLGLDTDPTALALAGERLRAHIDAGRVRLVRANFETLEEIAAAEGFTEANGVLLDLGVSSMQL